ncbi:hypothetical protein Ahy_A05g023154 [Arachis hypogaea]|uniref:Uncharacterized protein n=1 Tax=Arachis hypogaea TaxID=3818 RepID=A0A445D2J7_ARAHY|nr:hypothetical protein Ahy_A05g023154 [Arachis hypogaea]
MVVDKKYRANANEELLPVGYNDNLMRQARKTLQIKGDKSGTYMHTWLKMDAFKETYGHSISSEKSEKISSSPSKIKKPIGRLVKTRRLDLVEDGPEGTKVKKTFRVTCEKCGESSHTAKTCKGAPKAGTNAKGKVKGKSNEKSSVIQEEIQVPTKEANMHARPPQQPFKCPKQTILVSLERQWQQQQVAQLSGSLNSFLPQA